jgi:hypothetical protein
MKKTYFEAYIPHALKSLVSLLEDVADRGLEPLNQVVSTITLPNNL